MPVHVHTRKVRSSRQFLLATGKGAQEDGAEMDDGNPPAVAQASRFSDVLPETGFHLAPTEKPL